MTDDARIAKFARAARTHGQTGRYEHKFIGFNYRMQGFQAAVLRVKLPRLYSWTVRREEIGREYRGRLAAARLEIPLDDPGDECVYHQFVIWVNNRGAVTSQFAGSTRRCTTRSRCICSRRTLRLAIHREHFLKPSAPASRC